MLDALPSELLLRLMHATPEQLAEVGRILAAPTGENLGAETLKGQFEDGITKRGAAPPFLFGRSGDHWKVIFDGRELHLGDSLGARYLDYLFHRPNRPISAFDLEVAIMPEKGAARLANTRDPILDGRSVRQCLRELERLRAERDEAAEEADEARAARIDDEIGRLERQLTQHKRSNDTGERARNNVRKAIQAVTRSLLRGDATQKAFAEHIQQFVDTGYECVYHQAAACVWR